MTILILVEPSQLGFRATTVGPLELSAEAASAAEAVDALHEMIAVRLERGAILIDHPVHLSRPPIPARHYRKTPRSTLGWRQWRHIAPSRKPWKLPMGPRRNDSWRFSIWSNGSDAQSSRFWPRTWTRHLGSGDMMALTTNWASRSRITSRNGSTQG